MSGEDTMSDNRRRDPVEEIRLVHDEGGFVDGNDVSVLLAEVERLRDGIRRHRDALALADDMPAPAWLETCSAADECLWALLDDREHTDG